MTVRFAGERFLGDGCAVIVDKRERTADGASLGMPCLVRSHHHRDSGKAGHCRRNPLMRAC
jgi:hypothetical protein